MSPGPRWVVLGGSGFVGSAVVRAATAAGAQVTALPAPRLQAPVDADAAALLRLADPWVPALAEQLAGAEVVVNAAGLARPGAEASPELSGADALLPVVVVLAADAAGADRVVHLSSAAVQGDRAVLDASDDLDPRTPYARAKALGEQAVALLRPDTRCRVVVARATSVQGEGRATTASLRRLARSPLASVAGRGDDPVPVTSPEGLGAWVWGLATEADPPPVSLQPGEGWTTASLLRELGGREPLHLPVRPARALVRAGYAASRLLGGRGRAAVRRVELVWFGQRQR
ncbi:NAD-dependent epimerase/dehydratase family protein [Jannaschia sp. R86511]|uniref:NAD-dependent epimerase/dehydratase family protein n=1 Tax=Jannaschia sp. R86511 TaxID=3093853 RepID=UPI0036D3924B